MADLCLLVVALWPESVTSGNLTRTRGRADVYNIWHTVGVA